MTERTRLKPKPITALILALLLALGIYGFVANEAKKEIYYLCGNFTKGVAYREVTRQLATTHFTHYAVIETPAGKRIIHSSALHLNRVRCTIDFDGGSHSSDNSGADAEVRVTSASFQ